MGRAIVLSNDAATIPIFNTFLIARSNTLICGFNSLQGSEFFIQRTCSGL